MDAARASKKRTTIIEIDEPDPRGLPLPCLPNDSRYVLEAVDEPNLAYQDVRPPAGSRTGQASFRTYHNAGATPLRPLPPDVASLHQPSFHEQPSVPDFIQGSSRQPLGPSQHTFPHCSQSSVTGDPFVVWPSSTPLSCVGVELDFAQRRPLEPLAARHLQSAPPTETNSGPFVVWPPLSSAPAGHADVSAHHPFLSEDVDMSFVDAVRPAAASLADPAALWDSDSARSNPQGSFRGAHSQLPGGLALPRSQFTAHTDVDMPNSIVESVPYNNDSLKWAVYSRESQMLSSNQLEVNYEFVTCVMDASCLASDHLAIICYDISGFIQTFRYLTAEQVKLLARVHGVTHHSGRNDMHRSNVIAHSCSSLCPGNAAHLVFRRLKYPRRPKPLPHAPLTSRRVIDPLKIALTNDFSAPQPGIVRCGTLNSYFDFVRAGSIEELSMFASDPQYIVCHTSNISEFVALFSSLTVPNLQSIASCHSISLFNRKPNLLRALLLHSCEDTCERLCLLFRHLADPRSPPFVRRSLPAAVPDSLPTLQSMDDVDVLPICLTNDVIVDPEDGIAFVSTYRLNRMFDYQGLMSNEVAQQLHKADMELKYVAAHSPDVAGFISLFPHLTVNHMKEICFVHGIKPPKHKNDLTKALLRHRCMPDCHGQRAVYLFSFRKNDRDEVFAPRTTASVQESEVKRINMRDALKAAKAAGKPAPRNAEERKQAVSAAVTEAQASFPYVCSLAEQRSIIDTWQAEMDPPLWLPSPCAVCGRLTKRKCLSVENPLDYDLTLLQNPCLPVETLPSTYDFDAYDRAILCPYALRDRTKKAPMDICSTCKPVLKKKFQPLDALANFQYYARDELPEAVREAFNSASLYDLMMVSRSRCTRITHMFCDKPDAKGWEKVRSLSQGYSKGNVAIFPQDVKSVRPMLPPAADEIKEAMCALFIGPHTAPTRDNIKALKPVLVSKNRVQTMIEFLLKNNPQYIDSGVAFSSDNLDSLYPEDTEEAVPVAIELCCLEGTADPAPPSFADRGDQACTLPPLVETMPDDGSLVMDAVGYSIGENTPKSQRDMKAAAVSWCLDRHNFIKMQTGSKFVTDRDPGLLTFTFPALDPWGIGGFYEPNRSDSQHITFERQVKNLLLQHDRTFQRDPNFAYVCWNIIQKKEVNKHVAFRTDANSQASIVHDIEEIGPMLSNLMSKWESNPNAKPETKAEKKALRTLEKLKLMAKDLKGSSGYKQCRRNEIRAMMKKMATPALFITLNPADICDPLLGAMGGVAPDVWANMSQNARMAFIAKNPAAAAIFFDEVIQAFIRIILRYDASSETATGNGLFGRCCGYYGTVEAQGRGTLHCHMLVWLEGNPTPQELRDRMNESPEFQQKMFRWLESIIKCQLPSTTDPVVETEGEMKAPARDPAKPDPRLTKDPRTAPMTDEEFQRAFRETVEELAILYNWHDHRDTCWKHLKNGERRNDENCRMRIDGSINPFTHLDPATESIVLRRLHPRISNYNELVTFLLRCNMDIKYVGSGEAAKALVYYITDYITKGTLATHVGLVALEYAIKKNQEKFDPAKNAHYLDVEVNRSLTTKTIMALMSKQEMSHQQVMSYLVGGGDFYASHTFKVVKWGDFDRAIAKAEKAEVSALDEPLQNDALLPDAFQIDAAPPTDIPVAEDTGLENELDDEEDVEEERAHQSSVEQLTLVIQDNFIGFASNSQDYPFRSIEPAFESLCLWDHEERVVKISKASEEKRLERLDEKNMDAEARRLLGDEDAPDELSTAGRKLQERGTYAGGHDQINTHMCRFRSTPVVNVLLGDRLPRPDRGAAEKQRWYRAMLILFKPWRILSDLKAPGETWEAAFVRTEFGDGARVIMKNMNIENECKDAKDKYEVQRKAGKVRPLLPGHAGATAATDIDSLTNALHRDAGLDADWGCDERPEREDDDEAGPASQKIKDSRATLTEKTLMRVLNTLKLWKARRRLREPIEDGAETTMTTDEDRVKIGVEAQTLKDIRRDKRPAIHELQPMKPSKRRRLDADTDVDPSSSLGQFDMRKDTIYERSSALDVETAEDHLEDVLEHFKIVDNVEQTRAVRIIAEHFIFGMERQLLLYIAGVGGSGKSFVIKAVVEFFKRCGVSSTMMLSAPTGCAAVLIDGFTIHALTFLPKKKDEKAGSKSSELMGIWAGIKYLVIDEISMVSADLLAQISARINEGRAVATVGSDNMFGNVNVIVLGDMGQLRPVRSSSLFAHELVQHISPNTRETCTGIDALYGAWLWREFTSVVILRKNFRSEQDPEYTNLLARVRLGQAWDGRTPKTKVQEGDGRNYSTSDFNIINGRQLQGMTQAEQETFADAPIICATKVVRDLLNRELVGNYANTAGCPIHDYYAKDSFKSKPLGEELQTRTWNLRSSVTKDALGRLPLAIGMKVMIMDNIALRASIVNGTEGILRKLNYSVDTGGRRYVDCAYVEINYKEKDEWKTKIVHIVPDVTYFSYVADDGAKYSISRLQLPILPAYAYTDYKSQGRSLDKVIVDLNGCRSLQSLYVMLSRATSLRSVAVFRSFKPNTMVSRLAEEFRDEFDRLEALDARTTQEWESRRIASAANSDNVGMY